MLKMLVLLLSSLITLFKPIIPPIIETDRLYFVNSSLVGPFIEYDEDKNFSFSYCYSNSGERFYEEIVVSNLMTNKFLYSIKFSEHITKSMEEHVCNYTLSLKKYFSNDGFKIDYYIYKNNKSFFYRTVNIKPILKKDIDIYKDGIKRLISEPVAFKFDNGEITTFNDDFNFVDFKTYIDANNYYHLDLKENRFLYNQNILDYDSAEICILDKKGILNYFQHESDGKITLQLNVSNNGEVKGFHYKNKFFVDRLNLECADYKINGFVQTEKLFLPVNKKKDFLGTEVLLKIYGAGFNKYNLTFHLFYDVTRELIGTCNQSDYCVKGEVE